MSRTASSITSRLRRPRKSILSRPSALDVAHRVLGDELLVGALALQRQVLDQRPVADHDGRGVDAVLADQALQRPRHVDQVARRHVAPSRCGRWRRVVVGALQLLAGLHAVVEADLDAFRDELRDAVDGRERQAQHAADVARRGLRRELAEGDDLRHPLAAVLRDHVLHHALAAVHREVDVDVRHRLAARVEEALEEQVVADRVDVGDAERSRPRASRPPSRGPGRRRCRSRLAKATKSQTIRK